MTDAAARVRAQLGADYPPSALGWVSGLAWTGPQPVPLSQIDFGDADPDWAPARRDRQKLAAFAERIRSGASKPVTVIRTPGKRLLRVVDGHTRTLACLSLSRPVTAWVGTAKTAHGPWEGVHSHQLASDDGASVDLATAPGLTSRSGMISLDLPDGTIKPVPGGLADHHVTVVYLGSDLDDDAFAQACDRAKDAAASASGPLKGLVSGVGSFPPSDGSDGKVTAFAPVRIPGAKALRSKLGDLSASEHKDWVPHVTLAYIGDGDPLPTPVPRTPVTFTHLSVHRGDEVRRYPFAGSEHPAAGVDLSAQTPVLAVTPAPYGKPGGPGLYGVKGQKHSDYFEHVVQAMMRNGKTKGQASAMAWGILRRWAAGGGKVHPEVRAAAAAALAEEAAKSGHGHAGDPARVIELVGPKGYIHGWIFVGVPGADHHIAEAKKADAEGRRADAINHLTAAIGKTADKKAAAHLTGLRSEMAARAMGKPYRPKVPAKPSADALRAMSPAEKKAYVRTGALPARLPAAAPRQPAVPQRERVPAPGTKAALVHHMTEHHGGVKAGGRQVGPRNPTVAQIQANHAEQHAVRGDLGHTHAPAPGVTAGERLAAARKSGIRKTGGTAFAGKQGATRVETYKDDSKWISKTLPSKSDADREELAGKISDILGAGAPAIVRDGDSHVHEPFVPGDVAASLYRDGMSETEEDAAAAKLAKLLSTPEGKRIGLLDTLIGNQDRHLGNWMISPDGKPVPIDHNYSWSAVNRRGGLDTRSPFARAVYGGGVKPSDFTPAQLDGWQHELEAVKTAGLSPDQRKWFAMTMKAFRDFRAGKGQT